MLLMLCVFLILGIANSQPSFSQNIRELLYNKYLIAGYVQSYQEASSVIEKLKKHNAGLSNEDDVVRSIPGGSKTFLQCAGGVVLLISPDLSRIGAGSIIGKQGQIITSWHLVKNIKNFLVWTYDPNVNQLEDLSPVLHVKATVVAKDEKRDLALLQVNNTLSNMRMLSLGDNGSVDITQDIFTIGHPEEYVWSFSQGVVSQLRSNHRWSIGQYHFNSDVIQTQTPVSPGNSGGPVFNYDGDLIGVHSYRSKKSGINFAISVSAISLFLEENQDVISTPLDISFNSSKTYSPTVTSVDENDDGIVDVINIDTNLDSKIDVCVYDEDNNGTFEYYVFDENHDGVFDKVGIDINDDGTPNQISPYLRQ